MATFSEHFNLNKTQPELDYVDIIPEKDLPLFLDPYALSIKKDDWSVRCNEYIISFKQLWTTYKLRK